ncbi:MAG: MptD family putative ECF transporter S component [Velocimicrobium sp.]
MYESSKKEIKQRELSIKDLIVTGVFGAILLICTGIGGGVFAITPTLTFYFPLGAALLPGPVYLLYLAKVPRRGGVSLIGIIVGMLCLITGMHWGMTLGFVICSVVADLTAGTRGYKSKKINILSYIIYSYGCMGTYLVYFINPSGWAKTMLGNGTTQGYIDQMNASADVRVLLVMIIGTALVAIFSGFVGSVLLKKQFEKAGITE